MEITRKGRNEMASPKTPCPHCEAMLKPKFFNLHLEEMHGYKYRND